MNDRIPSPAPGADAPPGTLRLTMAQALVRYLAAQRVAADDGSGRTEPLFGGVFAIFGHGNVAGLGEALYQHRDALPTYRAHNEQAMAHSAIAYAKAHFRRRMMAVTTSIGPGATNLVTAAALAHVNRLPVLLLPGDVFVSRAPDPVLQQIEDFHDGGLSANDAFRPVSRYFDRIVHPAQLLTALPRALRVLTDAALCGPVTLALPQDVQTMAYDYPAAWFTPRLVTFHAPAPVDAELDAALAQLRGARRPFIVAGGGALYSAGGAAALRAFAERHGVPVGETQAGKSVLPWDHPLNAGAVGVTGSPAANALASEADCVLAVGTRLQDFTTGSNTLFARAAVIGINAHPFDALKYRATSVEADARSALDALSARLDGWRVEPAWTERAQADAAQWRASVEALARRYTLLARQASPDGAEIWLNWAIGAAHGAPFAGYVQATVRPAQAAASIAYLVFPDQWRRGVAKEAVGAVVAHLFARHPVERIDAEIDTRNRASVALVEALGFGRTGLTRAADTFKGAVSDEYRYSLIRPAR